MIEINHSNEALGGVQMNGWSIVKKWWHAAECGGNNGGINGGWLFKFLNLYIGIEWCEES